MRKQEKAERLVVLAGIAKKLHGSGIDKDWVLDATTQGIWMRNSFHCMDQHGSYCGWADFSYFFPWNEKLVEFDLRFHGPASHYLNRKCMLRDYLEDSLVHFLPDELVDDRIKHLDNQIMGGNNV